MTSIAHNGFGCPYCRTAMAVVPEEEDDDDDEGEYDDEEVVDDDVLRGFRFFMNNLAGEEHDEQDIEEEEVYIQYEENAESEERARELDNGLTPEYVAQRLVLQGVGILDLVKVMLLDHDEFEHRNEEFDRLDREMFGKLRIIISNFQAENA